MSQNKLKQIFANDPEMLGILEKKEQRVLAEQILKTLSGELVVNHFTQDRIDAVAEYIKQTVKKEVTPVKGRDYQDGEPGYTPVKYQDYFTEQEIKEFVSYIIETVIPIVKPVKNVDYRDGKDAEVDVNDITNKVLQQVNSATDSKQESLVKMVLSKIPQVDVPTIDDLIPKLIDEIKNKKLIEMRDIKNMPLNMNDMRWHGGGLSKVSHDTTLTGEGTPSSPLSVVGASAVWGAITGNISDQVDLQNEFATKANIADLGDLAFEDVVSVDGTTITGTGLPGNPLVAIGGGFSGTEASVPFVGADGLLTEDNDNFRWDDTNNQLQLGPHDPTYDFPEAPMVMIGDFGAPGVADFFGPNVRNQSPQGSTDYILGNDLDDGSLTGTYGDFGIAGSEYVPTGIGDALIQANDVYLYASIGAGNINLSAIQPGKRIRFSTAGATLNDLRMDIGDGTTTIYANTDTDITPAFTGGNWTGTNGWSVSAGNLVKVSNASIGTIEPSTPLTIAIDTTYRVTIVASGILGDVTFMLGGVAGTPITDGTTISYVTALTTDDFIISGAISSTATITSIIIQPLIDNTGDVKIEGGLILGGGVTTTSGSNVLSVDGVGVATFDSLPFGPNGVTPTEDYQLVPKVYVDTFVNGARFVAAVNAATTTVLPTVDYDNGTLGVGATLTGDANGAFPTIDGVAAVLNQTYLIKNQASGFENGAYELTTLGDGGTPFVLTRLTMYDTSAEIVTGTFFTVLDGTVNIRTQWALTTTGTVTVGTTALTFEQLSAPIVYTGGDGINVTGTVIDVDLASTPGLEFTSAQLRAFTDESSIERSALGLRVKALGVTNAMLAGSIADSKLNQIVTAGKVAGTSLTGLQNIPSGAGIVPVTNLGTGATNTKFLRGDGTFATPPGGGTVLSVTGGNVNNTDPTNPIVLNPTADGITITGSGTSGSPFVAVNNGTVESVTGLNTNNTDPANPVVRVSVDGTTITGSGTPADPLVSVGGGGGSGVEIITISGTIDDSNVNFTASEQPVLLVINGGTYEQSGGSITWSYSLGTITLSSPVGVGGSIYGIRSGTGNGAIETAGATFDGGGSAITTGSKGYISFNYSGTVTAWTILADQVGSIVVDVKKCTYAGFPTTSSIAGTEKPTLASAQKNQDVSLTSFNTAVTAGDIWEFVIDSSTTVTRVNLTFKIIKT